jgi:Family of unknown function (DUF6281)
MWRGVVLGVVLAGLLAGCSGGLAGGGNGAASCAAILHWQGRTYWGMGTAIKPRDGGKLGSGQYPPCNDTGGTGGRPKDVDVHRIPGVAPSEAVQTDGFVFVRSTSRLPAKVQALVHAPECTSHTSGAVVAVWGGVDSKYRPKFDGDIGQPPYSLELFVRRGPPRLLRAQIIARVSASTDGLLTPDDVRHVLWTGGTLSLDLGCSADGRYRVHRIGNRVPGAQ